VYDPEGKAHPIPKEHLPWHLPTDVDHTPTGEPPLSKSNELKERVTRIFGEGWTPDYETMDTFVDSSWYFLRYLDNKNDAEFSSKNAQEAWMPIDIYFGGAEHTTMHLLYSRFWQKALFKLGLATVNEPYKKRINRGLVLGPDGNKMSKSKGNVIDPDEQVKRLGADTVKMYLAFMGPYGESANYPWDMGGIVGIRRFLERVNGLSEHVADTETEETTRLLHKTVKKVTEDVTDYKFNTAISALMVFINHTEKQGLTRESYRTFLRLLAPFAPHLTDELWEIEGLPASLHSDDVRQWPEYEARLAMDQEIMLPVQINGKMRGTVLVSPDADEATVLTAIHSETSISAKIVSAIQKTIYVKGRIINLILEE
jgi:leucyl-tRNA synthetase